MMWAFYSYMVQWCLVDASVNVDEVNSPRFFVVSPQIWATQYTINHHY